MKSLDTEIDIILLTEIGREGHRYITSVFPNYDYEINLPKNNSYGGVAIVAKIYHNNILSFSWPWISWISGRRHPEGCACWVINGISYLLVYIRTPSCSYVLVSIDSRNGFSPFCAKPFLESMPNKQTQLLWSTSDRYPADSLSFSWISALVVVSMVLADEISGELGKIFNFLKLWTHPRISVHSNKWAFYWQTLVSI